MNPKSPTPSKRASKATKLPKASVRFIDPNTNLVYSVQGWTGEDPMVRNGRLPLVQVPCPSLRSARQRVKFERMGWEEKVEAVAKSMYVGKFPADCRIAGERCWPEADKRQLFMEQATYVLLAMGHTPNPRP